MLVTRKSPFTGKINTIDIDITPHQLWQWQEGGKLIQHAMPHLSADEREFLMTGITPEEWDKYIGDEE